MPFAKSDRSSARPPLPAAATLLPSALPPWSLDSSPCRRCASRRRLFETATLQQVADFADLDKASHISLALDKTAKLLPSTHRSQVL